MITNSCLYITDEQLSVKFYIEKLNFEQSSTVTFDDGEKWWLLVGKENNCSRIILIKKHDNSGFKGSIIINIVDCIYEYCRLKQTNIVELSEPKYCSIGLTISFFDPEGNRIILLEERDYEEPFIL